jgi:hypothetical protein
MNDDTTEQATRAGFFRPGNIVKLREPYKPEDRAVRSTIVHNLNPQGYARPSGALDAWHQWPGFAMGIIAEVVSTQRVGATGPTVPRSVSLHLYDPALGVLYMGPNDIPTYVDFGIDELIPWADTRQVGYVISDWAVE